jgi:hypothetical protein
VITNELPINPVDTILHLSPVGTDAELNVPTTILPENSFVCDVEVFVPLNVTPCEKPENKLKFVLGDIDDATLNPDEEYSLLKTKAVEPNKLPVSVNELEI